MFTRRGFVQGAAVSAAGAASAVVLGGWIMIDAWLTPDPCDACRKGRLAIEAARREFGKSV